MLVLLSQPLVALFLGLVCGVGLLLLSRSSFRAVRPAAASVGVAVAALSLFGRLAFATIALFLYQKFAPAGLAAFGLSLAGAFLVGYTVELVRYAELSKLRRPAGGRR